MAACVLARVLRVLRVRALVLVRVLRVLLCALVVVRVLRVLRARVRRHVLRSWFPPTPGNPGTPPRCVCLYVYAGHDPDHRGEHGKNSWDVLKWDVLKSVGRKYEKGKLCVSVLRTVKSRRGKPG